MDASSPVKVTLVCHTHWDREWYEPFDRFRDRLVGMMDTLIPLLSGGYPHFHLDGQTAVIDDYLAIRPDRLPEIEQLAREGRISVGPWVAQMDEFLTSGESMLRNIEMGMERNRELGGGPVVGHLPDQFGHVAQMPQILAKAGIERAVLWRGVPQAVERTSFWWESPDGSRVLVEYMPWGYSLGWNFHQAQDPEQLAEFVTKALGYLASFDDGDGRVLIMVGGDHHGPDPTLPQRLVEASPFMPGYDTKVGALTTHLPGPPSGEHPVWRGELRSAARTHLLPGVYSTRVHQKRERSRLEALLERYAEPLAALVPGIEWPEERLRRAWTLMLWNGAHDSVCGCSVDQVARDVDARYVEVRGIAGGIVEAGLARLAERVADRGVLRFNPSPFEREGVPGLGWQVGLPPPPSGLGRVDLRVEDGWAVADGVAFRFMVEPDIGDTYNFCPMEGAEAVPQHRLSVDGQALTASWDGLSIEARVSRGPEERFVRLEGRIHNERPDHRLRIHVRLPTEAQGSVAGSPFALIDRGLASEGGTEVPSPTWPARGVALAGGLAILAEGVIEYEVTGAELAVTLLRCVGTISRPQIATRNWAAGPDIATPGAQMQGDTEFALGILPAADRATLLEEWERFALPLLDAPATGGGDLPASASLLEVSGCRLSGVRRRGNALTATIWNDTHAPVEATVAGRTVSLGPAAFEHVPLDDR
jgi:hypothetical protein